MKKGEWLRIIDGDDSVYADGYFIFNDQEDLDLTVRKLAVLRQMLLPRQPEPEMPLPGGADVVAALTPSR